MDNYSVRNQSYKGMVKVLPTGPHPRHSTVQNSKFVPSNPSPIMAVASPSPQGQFRLPPPPKSPRPSLQRSKTILNSMGATPTTTTPIQNGEIRTFPTQTSPKPAPLQEKVPRRIENGQFNTMPRSKPAGNGETNLDVMKLHDEMAQLRSELAAMNEQMRQEDVWLKKQSEQVKELAQQQKQLESISFTQPSNQGNFSESKPRANAKPPPLPKSPRPKSTHFENSNQSNHISPLPITPIKKLSEESATNNTKNTVAQSLVDRSLEIKLDNRVEKQIPKASEHPNQGESKSVNNSPLKNDMPETRAKENLSRVNVKRISGLFEQAPPPSPTPIKSNIKRSQSFAPVRSQAIQKLQESLSPKAPSATYAIAPPPTPVIEAPPPKTDIPKVSSFLHAPSPASPPSNEKTIPLNSPKLARPMPITPKPISKPIPSEPIAKTEPEDTVEKNPPSPPSPKLKPKEEILTPEPTRKISSNRIIYVNLEPLSPPLEEPLPLPIPETSLQNIIRPSSPPPPPPQPKIDSSPQPDSSQSPPTPPSPDNYDKISLSSLSSASSSKADLMEQIREFGKSGLLKKTPSDETLDGKPRTPKSDIQTALESRFQAFYCSDSGEGESGDDSDNWED